MNCNLYGGMNYTNNTFYNNIKMTTSSASNFDILNEQYIEEPWHIIESYF